LKPQLGALVAIGRASVVAPDSKSPAVHASLPFLKGQIEIQTKVLSLRRFWPAPTRASR